VIVAYQELLPVALREARMADCDHVWQWNCAPDVRALSGDPSPVARPQHLSWYRARVASADPMWIVEENYHAVGVVRIDAGRISIALAPFARGRGIGRRAIATACTLFGQPVVAEILPTNVASRACFEACGFVRSGERAGFLTYTWSP